MKTKSYILFLLAMLMSVAGAEAQNQNRLIIPDLTARAGSTLELPLNMDNSTDIVAVEFDLKLPNGSTLDASSAKLSNRAADHTVTFRAKGGQYHCLIFSSTNSPFVGRSGQLMSVNMNINETYDDGSQHEFEVTNVVLALRDGSNGLTDSQIGSLTIQKGPDLSTTNVTADASSYTPGTKAVVSWQVSNIGGKATDAGWTEYLSVKNAAGVSTLLSTTYYEDILEAGASVSRQVEIQLPKILALDGEAKFEVEVRPQSETGESLGLRQNNTAVSDANITFNKLLTLTLPSGGAIAETYSKPMKCTLTRSGLRSAEETFTITFTTDDRVTIPSEVTISAGSSTATFYIQIADNTILDENNVIVVSTSGNGYPEANGQIVIEDNEYPDLTVTVSKNDVNEGETFQLTVSASRAPKSDLVVTISSETSGRFTFPKNVTLPAGQTSTIVEVTAVDDDVPSLTLSNTFTAYAPAYNKGEAIIILEDDDVPVLELTLTPNKVSEADGPIAVAATLRRTGVTNNKITVKLSDDSNGGIYYGTRTIELAKGIEEAHFNLGPIDNATVDGERIVNITAAVYISSCSCSATNESAGTVSAQLDIFDDDGPALKLTSAVSTLKEGNSTTLTISRNTADTSKPLTVTLNSDQDNRLTYDKTVSIPAGQSSASISITAQANDVQGDSFTAVFTATTAGYSSGTCYMMVTDQTLPDARIAITADKTEAEVGTQVTLTITVSNEGAATLPVGVGVLLHANGESYALTTSHEIAVGQSETLTQVVGMPTAIGTGQCTATVNTNKYVQELNHNNNTSNTVTIYTKAPYSSQITIGKSIFGQGEEIPITGQLFGNQIFNQDVQIYIINEGACQTINVKSDAQGLFATTYTPYPTQTGHFAVGACYPGVNSRIEQAGFDIYGIKRTSTAAITCNTKVNELYSSSFTIYNPSELPLTGVTAKVVSVPEGCNVVLGCPTTLAAKEQAEVSFTLTSTSESDGDDWQRIVVLVQTEQDVSLQTTLYYFCRSQKGKLQSDISTINTTMTRGISRDYPITITNIGLGETGTMHLILPEWMMAVTPTEMSSLNASESTTVILRLMPTDDMELNVPVTGSLGIDCENGSTLVIPYRIEPVSTVLGTLTVDVCDQNTYCTEEQPHLEGATVTVLHPVTNTIISMQKTGIDGMTQFVLPEGPYRITVTSDNHDSYEKSIHISPEREELLTVNLSFTGVRISYDVEPTEVEEEVRIVTKMEFETNVLAPQVVIDAPSQIDGNSMAPGDAVIVSFVLTNKGLINALNTRLSLPEDNSEWEFTALSSQEPFTLSPGQSVTLPVRIKKCDVTNAFHSRRRAPNTLMAACMASFILHYQEQCGKDLKDDEALFRMALKACATAALMNELSGTFAASGIGGGSGGSGGSGGDSPIPPKPNDDKKKDYTPEQQQQELRDFESPMCDPAYTECAEGVIKTLVGSYPGVGPMLDKFDDGVNKALEQAQGGKKPTPEDMVEMGYDAAQKVKDMKKLGDKLNGLASDVSDENPLGDFMDMMKDMLKSCWKYLSKKNAKKMVPKKATAHDFSKFDEAVNAYIEQLEHLEAIYLEFFGDAEWLRYPNDGRMAMFQQLSTTANWGEKTADELMNLKPSDVSAERYRLFIERMQQTNISNVIDWETMQTHINAILESENEAQQSGFESLGDLLYAVVKKTNDDLNEATKHVCSTIDLQFSQKLVMTREAFRGTLTVFNGNATDPITDFTLHLDEYGPDGIANDKFDIRLETINGFEGIGDLEHSWILGANETGIVTILYTPYRTAAPTDPVNYTFHASVEYTDPFTGLHVTRTLTPKELTVNPTAELSLTYFVQRDIYGDDPLTPDVQEMSIPAEFALLISNVGYGDAKNVRMLTERPQVTSNEKGLDILLNLVSSQLNGENVNMVIGSSIATDFGNINAHSTSFAQWWFTSSLLGHFTKYEVDVQPVSYENPDVSLVNKDLTSAKELIRSIKTDDAQETGFLVDEQQDADDTPDMLYLSNGETEEVALVSNVAVNKVSATDYELSITPSAPGWNYGVTADPTQGYSELKSVMRKSDGKEMPLRNFWQTDRTLIDGKDWLYDNNLHFAAEFNSVPETYVLTFEPTPEIVLEVASFDGMPSEGEIATENVDNITVTFTKPIDPVTFTADDITMNVQAERQDATLIDITSEDNQTFNLNLSAINAASPNGYYTLTVQTAGITDMEGFSGKRGKTASWILYRGGLVQLLTSIYPLESGSIERITGNAVKGYRAPASSSKDNAQYGSTVTFKAVPEEGYEFSYWTLNGETVSTEPTYSAQAICDIDIVANFRKKTYSVDVDSDVEGGTINGTFSGIYEYGTEMTFVAEPDEDFIFDSWTINNENVEGGASLTLTLDKPLVVEARFKRDIFHQDITFYRGWNWVSSYTKEAQPLNLISAKSSRVLGQFDELVLDPEYGLVGGIDQIEPGAAYKVNASSYFTSTFDGHLYDLQTSPLEVKRGWNWIAYPYFENNEVDVIQNAEEGDFVVSQTGFTEFADGFWQGSLDEFNPGEGYMYKSSNDKSLIFNFTSNEAGVKSLTRRSKALPVTQDVYTHKYPNTMNITAKLSRDGQAVEGNDYIVYAMAGDELRGVSKCIGGLQYITIYGEQPVDISFVIVDAATDEMYEANETLKFRSDVVGSRKAPYTILMGNATGIDYTKENHPMTIYRIDGILLKKAATKQDMQQLPKGIYIINGNKCYVK